MVTWCYAKNRTSFHRQDVFHEDDDRAPHGPGIQAATPLMPTNRGKKVECPLFLSSSHVVNITPNSIFNFVYSFTSLDQWKAARVVGREGTDHRGLDNGQVVCLKWPAWAMSARYTNASEPKPKLRQHPKIGSCFLEKEGSSSRARGRKVAQN